jgi:hypothetical protein
MRLEVFMRLLALSLLFSGLFGLATPCYAHEALESIVGKDDIKKIKIFSQEQDRINFFLTGNNKTKYRISNLSQGDAEKILKHLKMNEPLVLQTTPNTRGYLDVINWRKK